MLQEVSAHDNAYLAWKIMLFSLLRSIVANGAGGLSSQEKKVESRMFVIIIMSSSILRGSICISR